MSLLVKLSQRLACTSTRRSLPQVSSFRPFGASPIRCEKDEDSSFLPKWLTGGRVTTQSHSSLLSDKKEVYELVVHMVKPENMQEYLAQYQTYAAQMSDKTGAQLTGSWTVEIGEQDEAIHLWKYPGGYPVLNEARDIYRTDEDLKEYRVNRNMMLRGRKNEILLPFKFWGEIQPREGSWIYELRTYALEHGKSLEWGAAWAQGLRYRSAENERVAGFYTHIGTATQVHHFWAYKSLQSRDHVRGLAWSKEGWNQCVAKTVPLIRHLKSRIMVPTPFSPLS